MADDDGILNYCPGCNEGLGKDWDGWDCKKCKYALPPKHRKAYPKLLTEEEAREALNMRQVKIARK